MANCRSVPNTEGINNPKRKLIKHRFGISSYLNSCMTGLTVPYFVPSWVFPLVFASKAKKRWAGRVKMYLLVVSCMKVDLGWKVWSDRDLFLSLSVCIGGWWEWYSGHAFSNIFSLQWRGVIGRCWFHARNFSLHPSLLCFTLHHRIKSEGYYCCSNQTATMYMAKLVFESVTTNWIC